jgi:hypothetical protein
VGGPVSALREVMSGNGANIAAGAASAVIAVAATVGILTGAGREVTTAAEQPIGQERSRSRPGFEQASAPAAPGVAARAPASKTASTVPKPELAVPSTPTDRPLVHPHAPEPWVDAKPLDRPSEKAKPVYIAVPDVDLDCDGSPDVYYVASDDPWADEGAPVFAGQPPPGLDGWRVDADVAGAAAPLAPLLCPAP